MHLGVLTVGDILELIVAVGAIAVETEIRRGPLQRPELAAEGHDRRHGTAPPALQPRGHQNRRPDRPEEHETSTASLPNHCLEATLNRIGQGVVDAV